jgi:hypothetical protein
MRKIVGRIDYDWVNCFHDFEFYVEDDATDEEIDEMATKEGIEVATERIDITWKEG